jgi:hypothetical protein
MTETAAQTWLSSHHDIIPALEVNHRRALEILENHTRTLRDLAEVIVLDPGMSVSLYHEVNARRRNEEQAVDSVHAALALMGDSAIADLVMQHRVLDETHPDAVRRQSYHQLMSRSYHLLAQLDNFIAIQGVQAINEIRSAALLHNVGEFCACLFDHDRYQRYQEEFRESPVATSKVPSRSTVLPSMSSAGSTPGRHTCRRWLPSRSTKTSPRDARRA